jgi:hypothetical protein
MRYDTHLVHRFQTLTLILMIITAALHLWYLTVWQAYTFKEALAHGPGSAVAFALAIVVICPVGALLSYHLRVSAYFYRSHSSSSLSSLRFRILPSPSLVVVSDDLNLMSCGTSNLIGWL